MTHPPRLIARTLLAIFFTVAVILVVTFVVLMLDTRDRVRNAEVEKLQVGERVFTSLERRRQDDQVASIAALAENSQLKAALLTYVSESRFGGLAPEQAAQSRKTIADVATRLAAQTKNDVLAIVGTDGHVFAAAGPGAARWPLDQQLPLDAGAETLQDVLVLPSGAFRLVGARLRLTDDSAGIDQQIGQLIVGTSLDANYAQELSNLSTAGIVIAVNGAVVARTVSEATARALVAADGRGNGTATLNGEEYAIGTLLAAGPTRIYTLTSIDAAARAATRSALMSLGTIALGSVVLAFVASIWLARTLTNPINGLAGEIATMTTARDYRRTIEPTGTSRELDALAGAFNALVRSLTAAEAETRAAYLGAIRALAAALDARDPYTAGHSERVSGLSVLIARELGLAEAEVDVIRLGALLHDIGKIGVPDGILRKPGPLTTEEFEQIKRHPGLGARILRQVPFLAPHLPIVELHHERPDGKGYPFGLRAGDIPLDARIVHVADAFDAMTTARAYRPARAAAAALAELQRHIGTHFDEAAVEALVAAVPSASALSEPQLQELLGRGV